MYAISLTGEVWHTTYREPYNLKIEETEKDRMEKRGK